METKIIKRDTIVNILLVGVFLGFIFTHLPKAAIADPIAADPMYTLRVYEVAETAENQAVLLAGRENGWITGANADAIITDATPYVDADAKEGEAAIVQMPLEKGGLKLAAWVMVGNNTAAFPYKGIVT